MLMEIFASASATTKATGFASFTASIPTALGALATGEWAAVAVGAAVTGITAVFAIIGLVRDKQIAILNTQIAGLSSQITQLLAAVDGERTKRKAAEDVSDTWERRFHRLKGQMEPSLDPDSETHQ